MNDDIRDMEHMLSRFRPPGPDPRVRGRIVRQTRSRSRWTFAQAMATTLLVGLNLAQIGTSATQSMPHSRMSGSRTQQLASDIARLELPISKDEACAMAQQLSAGEGLVPLPIVHGDPSMNMNTGAIP